MIVIAVNVVGVVVVLSWFMIVIAVKVVGVVVVVIVIAGTVESNSQTSESPCLIINFHRYNLKEQIYYPPFDKVRWSWIMAIVFTLLCIATCDIKIN